MDMHEFPRKILKKVPTITWNSKVKIKETVTNLLYSVNIFSYRYRTFSFVLNLLESFKTNY